MSHDLESGMFREVPWHGLGTMLDAPPTADEAIKVAGLDWTVRTNPLALRVRDDDAMTPVAYETGDHPSPTYPNDCPICTGPIEDAPDLRARRCIGTAKQEQEGVLGCGWSQDVTDFRLGKDVLAARAVMRSSDGAVLGVVGPDWTPLQNHKAFDWFNPFVEKGLAEYWTAGSLSGGEYVWVLAKLKQANAVVGDDEIAKFILLSNAHNGARSVRVGFTPIVVCCANTLAQAHKDGESKLIRVRHTGSVVENLDLLRDAMNTANQEFEATAELYKVLLLTDIVGADVKRYVRTVFFDESFAGEEGVGKRIVAAVEEMYEMGRGAGERKHTLWRAYQAVTEYLSWGRGKTADSRLTSVWFGDSAKLNTKALVAALKFAGK